MSTFGKKQKRGRRQKRAQRVFNIEVEEDHSYVVDGIIVHNCQPFSVAGQGLGADDPRHLWPDFHRLIRAARPAVVVGEQVAGSPGYRWFDGVRADLAGDGYACRGVDVPALAVNAPHQRQRLYWVAVADALRAGSPALGRDVREGVVFPDAERRADHCADVSGRGDDSAVGDMADAKGVRERATHVAGSAVPRQYTRAHIARDGEPNCHLVNAPSIGRREGRAEPGVRSGRPAVAGSDASCNLGHALGTRLEGHCGHGDAGGRPVAAGSVAETDGGFWSDAEWLACHDGKARRTQRGLPLLAHGVSGGGVALGVSVPGLSANEAGGPERAAHVYHRITAWRGFGNAIVPQLGAAVLAALADTLDQDELSTLWGLD